VGSIFSPCSAPLSLSPSSHSPRFTWRFPPHIVGCFQSLLDVVCPWGLFHCAPIFNGTVLSTTTCKKNLTLKGLAHWTEIAEHCTTFSLQATTEAYRKGGLASTAAETADLRYRLRRHYLAWQTGVGSTAASAKRLIRRAITHLLHQAALFSKDHNILLLHIWQRAC